MFTLAPLQVKRSRNNPNGFFNDEYTKQTLDLKEASDFCHEIDASLPGFTAPNQWPEGEAGADFVPLY